MSYQVTARKWRPMVFEDIVGQSHVTTTLRNAIAAGRLSHAYLFSGPRGVGKTTAARILAKAINCISPKNLNPDNECELCVEITEGRSIDVSEIDGASNRGIDEIRNLRDSVRYGPAKGKYKVYVIDEVHMLTKEAFNALLKTLEEPPSYVLFVFATTEVHKVPSTILSRCQRFDFRRISIEEIMGRLRFIAEQERITIDDDALLIIAKKGDGSLRDAQSIFDQIVSFCGETVTAGDVIQALNVVDEEIYFRVTLLIRERDARGGLVLIDEIIRRGYDLREFVGGLNEHFRNLLIARTTQSTHLIETSEPYRKRYAEEAQHYPEANLFRLMKIARDLESSLRWTDQPRFRLEVALLQMTKMENAIAIDDLLAQLEELKKKVGTNGASGELHVAGSVMASPPTSARAQSSNPLKPPTRDAASGLTGSTGAVKRTVSYGLEKNPSPAPLPQAPAGGSGSIGESRIGLDLDATSKWEALVNAASSRRVALGTFLGESRFDGYTNGTLRIACPDDVHESILKKNRDFISDLANQIYGAKVRLETVLAPIARTTSGVEGDHPVIAALKRELGAEPVE